MSEITNQESDKEPIQPKPSTNEISNFHSVSNFYHPDWTPEFLDEIEAVLTTMYAHPTVQDMRFFKSDLERHLYVDDEAHHLKINFARYLLIQQMYYRYRDLGHTGTIHDMLMAIAHKPDPATHEEFSLGFNETKGITAVQWRDLFAQHQARQSAHGTRFDMFTKLQPLTNEIIFAFNCVFAENYEPFKNDGYTLSDWNPSNGTLYIELTYDVPTLFSRTAVLKILGLVNNMYLYIDSGSVSLRFHNPDGTNDVLEIPFSRKSSGYTGLIITYEPGKVVLRDALVTKSLNKKEHFFTTKPVSLHLLAPLTQAGQPVGLRNIQYFNTTMNETEQAYFLN